MEKILTVSIAAYNIEKYIDKLMTSLIDSKCMNEMEILIVNDGSKDKTAEIGAVLQEQFPDTVRLINKSNGGHGSTINWGIKEATGKYFRAIDGDDWVNSDALYELIQCLKTIEADLILCKYDSCYADGNIVTEEFPGLKHLKEYSFEDVIKYTKWMCYHAIVYKTSILQKHCIKLTEKCFYVDTEYDLFPIPYIEKVVFFEKPVYCYRRGTEGQSVSPESRKKNISHGEKVASNLLDFCNSITGKVSQAKQDYIITGTAGHCVWDVQSYFFFKRSKARKKQIIDFDNTIKDKSKEVFEKMEKLGKDSRIIDALRKTNYKAYWIIKMYKSIKGKFCK